MQAPDEDCPALKNEPDEDLWHPGDLFVLGGTVRPMSGFPEQRDCPTCERPGGVNTATIAKLQAAALRDWAVRVLDAWAATQFGLGHETRFSGPGPAGPIYALALFPVGDAPKKEREWYGDSADAARLAAAEAIWPTLTDAQRAELGERPQ